MLPVLIIITLDVPFLDISDKETSQGDSAAKTIYALGSLPLFDVASTQSSKHTVYADDLSCAGKAQNFDI